MARQRPDCVSCLGVRLRIPRARRGTAFPALEVDHPSLPPLNAPTYAAEFLAGQVAASAAMHGVLAAQQTGLGSHLDVSLQEAVAAANNAQFNRVRKGPKGVVKRTFSNK